ncbi:hypothetical protein pb186bvf_007015 [Paramecium bursaria]
MQQLQITCRDNQKMCVDIRLKQFLRAWSAIFDEDEEIIDFRADPQMIEVINVFYQMHEYKLENIYVADTIQSHKIEDCVDAQSVIFLSKIYYKCDNIQELIDWVRNMVPLLDESYRLGNLYNLCFRCKRNYKCSKHSYRSILFYTKCNRIRNLAILLESGNVVSFDSYLTEINCLRQQANI